MNKIKLREGFYYFSLGIAFLLITTGLVFPIIMIIMKIIFLVFGSLFLIGGLVTMVKSFYKKNLE